MTEQTLRSQECSLSTAAGRTHSATAK